MKSLENACMCTERFCSGDPLRRGAISSMDLYLYLYLLLSASSYRYTVLFLHELRRQPGCQRGAFAAVDDVCWSVSTVIVTAS